MFLVKKNDILKHSNKFSTVRNKRICAGWKMCCNLYKLFQPYKLRKILSQYDSQLDRLPTSPKHSKKKKCHPVPTPTFLLSKIEQPI